MRMMLRNRRDVNPETRILRPLCVVKYKLALTAAEVMRGRKLPQREAAKLCARIS